MEPSDLFLFYELITALEAIGTVYSWGGGGDHPPQERAGTGGRGQARAAE
jgi:hypothetical protein